MSRPGGLSAEDKAAIKAAQEAAAKKTQQEQPEPEPYTPPHAEGSDEKRKKPKVYTGPQVTIDSTIGETKPPEPIPTVEPKQTYKVGGTGPKFKETTQKLQTLSDEFFKNSGLPSEQKLIKLSTEKPGSRLAPSPWKTKDTKEAFNRLGYVSTQMMIGGAIELGFPFSLTEAPPPSRDPDRGLRVLGGLLTPSPLDLLVSQAMAKVAKSKTWRKIIGKYGEVDIDELEKATLDEIRQLSKFKEAGQKYSEYEMRYGGIKQSVKRIYRNKEEIAQFYADHPELATAERSSAGAAQVPRLVLEYEEMIDDLGWDKDYYFEFMKSRAPELPVGALTNILIGVSDRGEPIEETIINLDNYVDRPDNYKLIMRNRTEAINALEDLAKTIEDEDQKAAIVQEVEQLSKQKQIAPEDITQIQESIQEVTQELVEETFLDEPLQPQIPIPEIKDAEHRRNIMASLVGGRKQRYRVKFTYPRGSQAVTVEARSFPEALNKAQRIRRGTRYPPSVVDVVKL